MLHFNDAVNFRQVLGYFKSRSRPDDVNRKFNRWRHCGTVAVWYKDKNYVAYTLTGVKEEGGLA